MWYPERNSRQKKDIRKKLRKPELRMDFINSNVLTFVR